MSLPKQLKKFFPFLSWPRPNLQTLQSEAMAGLTVGVMVIPQGVAYAQLAGMPLITGLYASFLPALAAVLFSASARLSVGPVALTSLLVSASLYPLAIPGSSEWIELAVWLALLSGALQIILGLVRFGWLMNLVNAPVLMAFTQGAAILIIASQLPSLLGLQGDVMRMFQNFSPLWSETAFGLGSLLALIAFKRWHPNFPGILLVVIATALISWLFNFESAGGRVVGLLPLGLPHFYVPSWPGLDHLSQLLMPTLIITLISFLETAASAKVDNERKGERWDQDQDLIGQGLAKLASGFSGAFATSSSFSRSALNLYAGAQTGWATLFSVIVVLLALLFFTPLLRPVPQAVLAAIVIVAVINLIKPRRFINLWRIARAEAIIALLTFVITIATTPNLYWGVLAGMLMAFSLFLYRRLHPRIIEASLHPDGTLRSRVRWGLPQIAAHTLVMRMDADLDFASAGEFERFITEYLSEHPKTYCVCILTQPITQVDATGVEVMIRIVDQLQLRSIQLMLVGMKLPVEQSLRAAGLLHERPLLAIYRTNAEALTALKSAADARSLSSTSTSTAELTPAPENSPPQ